MLTGKTGKFSVGASGRVWDFFFLSESNCISFYYLSLHAYKFLEKVVCNRKSTL